jgi:hypothetical protein
MNRIDRMRSAARGGIWVATSRAATRLAKLGSLQRAL